MKELLKTRLFGNMWGLFRIGARLPEHVGLTPDECLTKSWMCDSGGRPRNEWANTLKDTKHVYRRIQVETSNRKE